MRQYVINAGNSVSGPVGFVFAVKAQSPEAALEQAQAALTGFFIHTKADPDSEERDLHVCINGQALTLDDVEEGAET